MKEAKLKNGLGPTNEVLPSIENNENIKLNTYIVGS